jgi:hypothetical protein
MVLHHHPHVNHEHFDCSGTRYNSNKGVPIDDENLQNFQGRDNVLCVLCTKAVLGSMSYAVTWFCRVVMGYALQGNRGEDVAASLPQ